MLKNYVKTAVAVLLRRKFVTFVNVFGAALTLTVLVVGFAFLEGLVSPEGAQHRHRNILTVYRLGLADSDTGRRLRGGPGYAFYEHYLKPLSTPDLRSYSTLPQVGTSYVDGRKITVQLRRTDGDYWKILDFDLRAGRTLTQDDVDAGRFVAVVNESTAAAYFPGESAVGKTIQVDTLSFEVIGVVADESEMSYLAYADVWVPLTATASSGLERQWIGQGMAMLYVEDPGRRDAVKAELRAALDGFEYPPDPSQFDTIETRPVTALELVAEATTADLLGGAAAAAGSNESLVPEFLAAVSLIALLFMALPAVNLVNLNVGRIMERASEIGVRKAAGATKSVLVGQFIFENVVLAAVGGVVALSVAPWVLDVLSGVFRYSRLGLDVPVFVAGLAFVIVFGVLSGAYPAWKMARLEPAAALRGHTDV